MLAQFIYDIENWFYEEKQAYMAYKSRLNIIAKVYWLKIKTFIHNL